MQANLSVFPLGKGQSLSGEVAKALKEIEKSGLDYRLTDMGTILEGDWDRVLRAVKKVRDRLLKDTDRLYITLSIDDRKDRRRIGTKTRSVERVLKRKLKK